MLSTKLPNASRSTSSRSIRTSWNMPSVSAVSAGSDGAWASGVSGRASSPATHARHASDVARRLGAGVGGAVHCPERRGELGGVLPHIQPHRAEAEGLHLAPHRPDQRAGQVPAPRVFQLRLDQPQVADQRIGRGVGRGIHPRVAALGRTDHDLQPAEHASPGTAGRPRPDCGSRSPPPRRWPPAPAPAPGESGRWAAPRAR